MAEPKKSIVVPVSDDELQRVAFATELEALKRKLAARKDMPGYEENRREIERRIAELEAASR